MPKSIELHEDRYFSSDPAQRAIARRLYAQVRNLPIISPHGHVDPNLFINNTPFPDPTQLLVIPDHYLFRMLYSQGIPLEHLGISRTDGGETETDHRRVWQILGDNFYLFRGTPTGMWLKHELKEVLGIHTRLESETAMDIYDQIVDALAKPENFPRAMYERFNIEVLSITDFPTDTLDHVDRIRQSGWKARIVPTFRPDNVTDLMNNDWRRHIDRLSEITGEDCTGYEGYIRALEKRRAFFREKGATATDHGVFNALTIELSPREAEKIYSRAIHGRATPQDAEVFTAHMLMEMARMSGEDGMTMQIHSGVFRNHNPKIYDKFGPDKGCDIPVAQDMVRHLKPLLNRFGNNPDFTLIVFTMDETVFARELAPLAGHYPAMKIGPAWWFNDSREGMLRYRRMTTETAGIYNTVGFNDDTRAFPSIPARHDLARRTDARYLAELVAEHVLDPDEAEEMIVDLAVNLPKRNYKF